MRADVYLQAVLDKCSTLTRSGLWAPSPHLRPQAWLENFNTDQDRLLAATLLDNFVYYSDRATDQLLRASYAALEDRVLTDVSHADPETVLASAVLTPIEGETPNRSDSGNLLCRRARNVLGIPESRVVDPKDALQAVQNGVALVLIDDFLGSGEQFIHTWERKYSDTSPKSFKEAYARQSFPVFLLALVATSYAIKRVRGAVPNVLVSLSHELDDAYSVRSLRSPPLHPPIDDFSTRMSDFLARHAGALTLPSFIKNCDWPSFGFGGFGLLFAFEHSIPDSSLPIFWAPDGPNWVPLVRPR